MLKAYGGFQDQNITYTEIEVSVCTGSNCDSKAKLDAALNSLSIELLFLNVNFNPKKLGISGGVDPFIDTRLFQQLIPDTLI